MSAKKILVVDDDQQMLALAALHLKRPAWEIVAEQDVEEALRRLLLLEHFDLILTDIDMPGMNGITFMARARAVGNTCPFIVITGLDDVATMNAAYRQGIFTFVTKPLNWPVLVAQIEMALA